MCTLIPILFLFVAVIVMVCVTVLYHRYELPLRDDQATAPTTDDPGVISDPERATPTDRRGG